MKRVTAILRAVRRRLSSGSRDLPETGRDESSRSPASTPAAFDHAESSPDAEPSPADDVIQLCRSRGGRIKQQTVIEETGWSESRVSRLLSEMEDAGRIARVPVGREKVVALPGTLPESSSEPAVGV